jgi:Ca2+-binding EF-hand superfamily protein
MKTGKSILAVSALALAFGSAWAADKDKSAAKDKSTAGNVTRSDDSGFAKMDKNKDGYISKAEAKGHPAFSKDFAKRDMNNDGKLNRAEYLAAAAKADVAKTADKVEKKARGDKSSTGSSAAGSSSTKK